MWAPLQRLRVACVQRSVNTLSHVWCPPFFPPAALEMMKDPLETCIFLFDVWAAASKPQKSRKWSRSSDQDTLSFWGGIAWPSLETILLTKHSSDRLPAFFTEVSQCFCNSWYYAREKTSNRCLWLLASLFDQPLISLLTSDSLCTSKKKKKPNQETVNSRIWSFWLPHRGRLQAEFGSDLEALPSPSFSDFITSRK